MNSPERLDEICRWIRFAREDLEAAEALLAAENFVPRHVCWLAQQAAEKVLKAALVSEGVDFPFRHDLDALRNLLPGAWHVKTDHPDLAELTEWAVEARYPGDWPDATVETSQRAASQSRAVYDCIVADLERHGIRCTGAKWPWR
jgi:HEPN domain-containing protein